MAERLPRLMSRNDIAKDLGISPASVDQLILDGKLSTTTIGKSGKHLRIFRESYEAFIARETKGR